MQKGKARTGLAFLCLFLVTLPLPAFAQRAPPAKSNPTSLVNWALGRNNAPVTLLEYGSLTCGHRARLSAEVMPTIKRRYVDTGAVRYIFRPFPTPPNNLSVALHALTLCAGPSRYYGLLEQFFARQADIFEAAGGETGPGGTIFAIAEDFGGLSFSQSEACLRDTNRQNQVIASAQAGADAGVTATPALFVNGVLLADNKIETLTAALDRALAAAPRRPATKAKRP
jgi:protein-disulfide isomerase